MKLTFEQWLEKNPDLGAEIDERINGNQSYKEPTIVPSLIEIENAFRISSVTVNSEESFDRVFDEMKNDAVESYRLLKKAITDKYVLRSSISLDLEEAYDDYQVEAYVRFTREETAQETRVRREVEYDAYVARYDSREAQLAKLQEEINRLMKLLDSRSSIEGEIERAKKKLKDLENDIV